MKKDETLTSIKDTQKMHLMCGIPTVIGIIFTICVLCDGGLSAWVDYAFAGGLFSIEALLSWGGLFLIVSGTVFYKLTAESTMIITKDKVTGKTSWGKEVNIPLDSISAVELTKFYNGIGVSSSAGIIRFMFIKNNKELYNAINELIQNRSNNNSSNKTQKEDVPNEIRKYKELLDDGLITQKEYDEKKKQLLNL